MKKLAMLQAVALAGLTWSGRSGNVMDGRAMDGASSDWGKPSRA